MKWLSEVDPDDYSNALNYLTLKLDNETATAAIAALKKAPLINLRANDILRACDYTPLSKKDPCVKAEMEKDVVSPVLLVSYEYGCDIADGFHRVNASYIEDPGGDVPCKITYLGDRNDS